MDYYTLKATRSRVLDALQDLAESVRGLRALAEAGKLNSPESDALGTRWEEQRDAFENSVIKPLPRHVREKLFDGEDSVTSGWVLRFQPRDPTVIEQLELHMRSDIEAAGGWLRCTTWDSQGSPQLRAFTAKALLQNLDWIPDWTGVDVAIARAEQVFEEYDKQGRTDLDPNEADIEALIREIIAAHQPDWMPSGKGFEASQFALMREAGTLQIPPILEVPILRREILLREEPCRVEHLVDSVLDKLQRSGVLKLFSYRPISEPKECSYYYLAERRTPTAANGATPGTELARDQDGRANGNLAANVFRRDGDVWLLRFHGKPDRPVAVKHSVNMLYVAELLLQQGRKVQAVALVQHVSGAGRPRRVDTEGTGTPSTCVDDPILDEEAREDFQKRLADLDEELARAEKNCDEATLPSLRQEKDALNDELRKATGLYGRDRDNTKPQAEKARITVRKALSRAYKKIDEVHHELSIHLRTSISTGQFVSYDPSLGVVWDVET